MPVHSQRRRGALAPLSAAPMNAASSSREAPLWLRNTRPLHPGRPPPARRLTLIADKERHSKSSPMHICRRAPVQMQLQSPGDPSRTSNS